MANFIVFFIYTYSFLTLIYLYYSINMKLCINDQFNSQDQIIYLNKRHVLGILGMLLAIIASAFQTGTEIKIFFFNWNTDYTALTYLCFLIALVLSTISAKKEISNSSAVLAPTGKIFYLIIRIVFLVTYEFYFRVVLLQAFYFIPIVYAVIINVILYSAAHAFSSKKELIGSIPFGFALCLLTILHQSVWPAIMLHIILCVSYESLMLYTKKINTKTIRI
jgi:hypothetical protein